MAPLGGVPGLVLLFSGKRKSGKDFVTEALQSRCPWGGEGGGPGDPESRDTSGVLGCDGVSFGVGVLRLQNRGALGGQKWRIVTVRKNSSIHTPTSKNQAASSPERGGKL